MAIGLRPRWVLCVLCLVGAGCGSNESDDQAGGGSRAGGASSGAGSIASEGGVGAAEVPAKTDAGGAKTDAGGVGGTPAMAGEGAGGDATGGGPPPAVDGRSVYVLECRGDSKDCDLASVPCLGVGSPTPGEAAGWACSNRCNSEADCSSAPTGATARASCVPFTSARHCMLVCQNEGQSFDCPTGMGCYTPPKSPIGYCLWQ